MRLDLHLHTTASDGSLDPRQVLELARQQRLVAWAIADHDCADASLALAGEEGLIPAIELTAADHGREIHILGYGLRFDHPSILAALAVNRAAREERLTRTLVEVKRATGMTVDPALCRDPRAMIVSRVHIARGLTLAKAVADPAQAFERFLADAVVLGSEAFITVSSAVAAIHAAGGVAILAHPGFLGDLSRIESLLSEVPCDGIEVRHPNLAPGMDRLLDDLASRRGLLVTAGSDFHRPNRKPIGSWRLSRSRVRPFLERVRFRLTSA